MALIFSASTPSLSPSFFLIIFFLRKKTTVIGISNYLLDYKVQEKRNHIPRWWKLSIGIYYLPVIFVDLDDSEMSKAKPLFWVRKILPYTLTNKMWSKCAKRSIQGRSTSLNIIEALEKIPQGDGAYIMKDKWRNTGRWQWD